MPSPGRHLAATLTLAAAFLLTAAALATSGPAQEDPEFTDIIENITVPAGRNVKLSCSVKNLGTYKAEISVFYRGNIREREEIARVTPDSQCI
ncbi:Hypothetical predicted protein [Cloeon dipterum]|uniref:Ig-like domain-containing protein n=1 Tax=Cloeon dipterum TaxID=197152 RepID=A0A8S1C0U0_9INSE|nr:Hypothetical predicted protein [Cloeon dipterum]